MIILLLKMKMENKLLKLIMKNGIFKEKISYLNYIEH